LALHAPARDQDIGLKTTWRFLPRVGSWAGVTARKPTEEKAMPKFVIERELTGAGKLAKAELQAISQKSCAVLQGMGPQIQWLQSFVTDDKIYCVYIAPNEDAVRQHAQKGGFPANVVARVRSVIDPTTAEH
jgi:hypothetical protein